MKKLKILTLVLALGVALMGSGYAAWTDSVVITNKVQTGYITVEVLPTGYEVVVTEANSHPALTHDVTWTPTANADNKYKSGTIAVTNLYEGATLDVKIPVKNTGAIPVVFDLASTTSNTVGTTMNLTSPIAFSDKGIKSPDGQTTISAVDNILDCGEEGIVTYRFKVGQVNLGTTYSFTVTPYFKQWNIQ